MNIGEMHIMFRQYAQQMGMQNVRAILPEQIDLLLNTSIVDTTNMLVRSAIGVANDRIVTDSSKLLQINSLSPLYKVVNIPFNRTKQDNDNIIPDPSGPPFPDGYLAKSPFVLDVARSSLGRLTTVQNSGCFKIPEYMYIVDFSIEYAKATKGYDEVGSGDNITIDGTNRFISTLYPVRLIHDSYLADVLNDFTTKNRLRSPIIVVHDDVFDLYIEKFTKSAENGFLLKHNLIPLNLRFSYIKHPRKVQYNEDLNVDNIDCDLPENLHVDIVKHAVDLYRVTISNSTFEQQNAQGTQQENGGSSNPTQRQ